MSEERQKYWERLKDTENSTPYYQMMGLRIVELGEGRARLTMPVETKHIHSHGFVYGGAIASIADEATAYALFSLLAPEESVSTVELKLNYLRPVNQGELIAEGRIVHRGRQIAVADVEVWRDNGKLVAKGMATMMISPGRQQKT